MTTLLIAFVSALLVGALLTRSVRDLAIARGWLDVAQSSRKVHTKPIPRLGGVAIVFGFFAPIGGLLLVDSDVGAHFQADPVLVYSIIGGGLSIALLGLYDDFLGARARQKFLVQFGVAALLCAAGLRVEVVSNPFGDPLVLGWLAWPVTMLWIVGVINALNLIDGLDGLAGGVAFIATATCFILAWSRGDILMAVLMAALAGALLGFLIFNFNPASIFMGDTGSMFLGFVLAVASLRTASKSDAAVATLVPLITLGLPIMDTLLAMARRSLMGRPMFSADKEHIHHRLMLRLRLSHRGTVLTLYGLCCFLAAVSIGMSFSNGWQSALLLVTLTSVAGLLLRQLGYLDFAALAEMVDLRKRNKELRRTVQAVSEAIVNTDSLDELWSRVEPLAETLNVAHLGLRFESEKRRGRNELVLYRPRQVIGISSLKVAVPVQWGGVNYGALVADWRDGRAEVLRDEELGLERVAAAMGQVLSRIAPPRATIAQLQPQPEVLANALRAVSGAASSARSSRA